VQPVVPAWLAASVVRDIDSPPLKSRHARGLQPLKVIAFGVVFLQRLALPGNIPLVLPLTYICIVVAIVRHAVAVDRRRLRCYVVAMTICALSATISTAAGARSSVTSIGLLVVTYAPIVAVARAELQPLHRSLLVFLERCTAVVAMLAILASLAQFAGWHYTDYVGRLLPKTFLLQGYNTFDVARYGSTYVKTNAFVCLEPSFVSELAGIGLLLVLLLRRPLRRAPLYVGALIASLSGTGMALLLVCLAVLALRRGPKFAVAGTLALTVGAALLMFTPPGRLMAARATEAKNPDSSGSARFVQPYEAALASIREGAMSVAVGHGPGSTSESNNEVFQRSRRSPVDTVITKLVREYGVPAMLAFLFFVAAFLIVETPSPVLSVSALLGYLVLSGSLLTPGVVYLFYIMVALFPRRSRVRTSIWTAAQKARDPSGRSIAYADLSPLR
jgi:hypothetical protein